MANLEQIEEHIDQQEFLRKLFQQWTEYMPTSLRTPADVRARANAVPTDVHACEYRSPPAPGPVRCGVWHVVESGGALSTRQISLRRKRVPSSEKRPPPPQNTAIRPSSNTPGSASPNGSIQAASAPLSCGSRSRTSAITSTRATTATRRSRAGTTRCFVKDDLAAYQAGLDVFLRRAID